MKFNTAKKPVHSLKHLLVSLQEPKSRDYTYTTIFFIVFSIFIFFAIRPSLSTALSLSKQEASLKSVDSKYELLIGQIVQIQSELESVRDKLYLVDDALPAQPFLNVIVRDIQDGAAKNHVTISQIDVRKVNLVGTEKKVFRVLSVNVGLSSTFDDYINFEKDLIQQRRLKMVKSVDIVREELGSSSATLKIKAEIEGYYL